jgi:hypothetical protein
MSNADLLGRVSLVGGSRKAVLVGLRGFEPPTS